MIKDINVQNNSVAIVGWHEGGAGQIQPWLENSLGYYVSCFINPTDEPLKIDPTKIQREVRQFSYPTSSSFKNKPLINSLKWDIVLNDLNIRKVLVTTDNQHQRSDQIRQAREGGLELISAIHPTSLVMNETILGDNIILYPRSYVGYRAELYDGVIVNVGAQIEHHNVIREYATIDPGVVFTGGVTIGRYARVHTGAKIRNGVKVGENSIVGMGAVIIKNVPDNVIVVGVPGRILRDNNEKN